MKLSYFKTADQLVASYKQFLKEHWDNRFDIRKWLGFSIEPLIPGDMLTFIGGTGVGKTYISLSLCQFTQVPILMIQLELSDELVGRRMLAMDNLTTETEIESRLLSDVDQKQTEFNNVLTVSHPHVTPEIIDREIQNVRNEENFSPSIVLVDYFQLLGCGVKGGRYEVMSNAAEKLRIIARTRKVIMIILSQIGRDASKQDRDVALHDAKETGSIENSSSLVIGLNREREPVNRFDCTSKIKMTNNITAEILKNSHGPSGEIRRFTFDWERTSLKPLQY